MSILPEETELGRKRKIDQSSCNKDFSCVSGFCPSFVSVIGAEIKKKTTEQLKLPNVPDITPPSINKTHNIVVTGIGGTEWLQSVPCWEWHHISRVKERR